ncbi:MAG: hypothetical protein ACRCVT_13525 [Leadbetterella sp.]
MKLFAKIISFIGNPIILLVLYSMKLVFSEKILQNHPWMTLSVFAFAFIPLLIYIYLNVQNGTFSTSDVSDRIARKKLYRFVLGILTIILILSFVFNFDNRLRWILIIIMFHICICFFINNYKKISLHTSFSFLVTGLFLGTNIFYGLFFFGFINAWSRYYLRKHTPIEIVLGLVVGLSNASIYYMGLKYIN